jgi:sugar (pentulose or hexulose) kinase
MVAGRLRLYTRVLYRYPETAAQIAVIGACGQMHGTVLLDEQGELVEDRALLWNDKRSQPQVDAFIARRAGKVAGAFK